VLWASSRRHRTFLGKNYDWYPRLVSTPPWLHLFLASKTLKTREQAQFLYDNIRIYGEK